MRRHIVRSGRSTQPDEKSGPPEQGIPGRAYQIDAGWMGGASIDRSRRGRSVDAGLADIVAVGVELTDPMAGPISGGHHIGGGVAGGCCRADEGADAEADAKADTQPRAWAWLAENTAPMVRAASETAAIFLVMDMV